MEALARLGLFGFGYITIFILSNLVADTNEREANAATILENYHGVSSYYASSSSSPAFAS